MSLKTPPNILIVMTDHQRWDTIQPGHPCRTPVAEKLSREGVVFSQTYCPTPHCCPARASFHSGLYPSRHGVWNNICNEARLSDGINPGVSLWSSELRDAGYGLHFIGKWHVDTKSRPADHGWAEHGVTATAESIMGESWSDVRSATAHATPSKREWGQLQYPGYIHESRANFLTVEQPQDHADPQKLGMALDVLGNDSLDHQPWCMFLGLTGPHDPYQAPTEFLDLYDPAEIALPPSYTDRMHDKPNLYRRMREQIFDQWGEDEARDAIRHYWAYCSWLDSMLGKLLDRLDERGETDNTLVLFCSDHGDYCGDHGLFAKGIPSFEGAYHVPAIVRWPRGIVGPGREVDAMVSLCDFGPTFLEAAGVVSGEQFSGLSLVPFLRQDAPPDWRTSMLLQCNGVENYVTQRSIRTPDWRYTYNAFDFDELYDLSNDPHEMVNLAGDPKHKETLVRLCGEMWALAAEEDDMPGNNYVTVALAPVGPVAAFTDKTIKASAQA